MPAEQDPDLESIRRRYQALLDGNAGEPAFQRFFADHPMVLAGGLPKRVEVRDLRTQGRPGKSEADFVFVHESADLVEFGVIELKKPGMRILKRPRKLVVTLTNAAATAVAQAREYAAHLQEELLRAKQPDQGISRYPRLYVVMGTSDKRTQDLLSGMDDRQLCSVFPDDVRIVTYDGLLARFLERAEVRAGAETTGTPHSASHYVMLPLYESPDFPRRPFAISAPQTLLDAMRQAQVTDISIYSHSHATASAGECRGVVDQHADCGLVYLVVTSKELYVLRTVHDRVVEVERAEHRDEKDALAAVGATDHVFHQLLDPSGPPWLVKPASEVVAPGR